MIRLLTLRICPLGTVVVLTYLSGIIRKIAPNIMMGVGYSLKGVPPAQLSIYSPMLTEHTAPGNPHLPTFPSSRLSLTQL